MSSIRRELPDLLALDTIREEETHTYEQIEYDDGTTTTRSQYTLDKAPVIEVESVSGVVDDSSFTFTAGTDYEIIDTDNDGRLETIEFVDGGQDPDPGSSFTVTYVARSVLSRYTSAYDDELDRFRRNIEYVIDTRHPEGAANASFVDNFERNGLVEYTFESGSREDVTVQNRTVYTGELGLKLQNVDEKTCTRLVSTNGLRLYPQRGDIVDVPLYLTDVDDEISIDIMYTDGDGTEDEYYRSTVSASDDELTVQKDTGGMKSSTTAVSVSQHTNEWLQLEIDVSGTDDISVSLSTDSGQSLGTTQITDIEYQSGGIRYEACNSTTRSTMYIDAIRIDDRNNPELDRIGALFGEIGERRGRSDDDYAAFLRSVVQSFSGRGTVAGIVFAVASAYLGDEDEVTVNENFSENTYTIRFDDPWTPHSMQTLGELAQLADPSGVELAGFEYGLTDTSSNTDSEFDSVVATNTRSIRWDSKTYDDFNYDDETPGDAVDTSDGSFEEITTSIARPEQWDNDSYDELQYDGNVGSNQTVEATDTVSVPSKDRTIAEPDSLAADTLGTIEITEQPIEPTAVTDTIATPGPTGSASDGTLSADAVQTELFAIEWERTDWETMEWTSDTFGSFGSYGTDYGDNYGEVSYITWDAENWGTMRWAADGLEGDVLDITWDVENWGTMEWAADELVPIQWEANDWNTMTWTSTQYGRTGQQGIVYGSGYGE